jgi:hypothetical protein
MTRTGGRKTMPRPGTIGLTSMAWLFLATIVVHGTMLGRGTGELVIRFATQKL